MEYFEINFFEHLLICCYDDLGAERVIKYYGNECQVMAEILLSKHESIHFERDDHAPHSNLMSAEIESYYGSRVRSRLREAFNLIPFDTKAKDKRV